MAFTSVDGVAVRGVVAGMSRHSATFEVFSPGTMLSISELLGNFTINHQGKAVYAGRAVIRSVVNSGGRTVCEVTLDEPRWLRTDSGALPGEPGKIAGEFKDFLNQWQQLYKVSPEFKLAVADMQTFMRDLQSWLNQLEVQIKLAKLHPRDEAEILRQMAAVAIPAFNFLFERFESVALKLSNEHRAAHASYMRQTLHPFVLCAPFAHRTYTKPRGYAGDYEMVNMIIRNGLEGESLYAKILHAWFVSQPPAEAHRNRLKYLAGNIERESCRPLRLGRPARIFNFACGPAAELLEYFQNRSFPSQIHFTLADFDDETLEYARRTLRQGANETKTVLNFKKMSVHQLVKESRRMGASDDKKYDLVYCAGLFDYLPDSSCRDLTSIFYDMVIPGGLLIVTNVEPRNPLKCGMEYLLDWHLIYRDEKGMRDIRPEGVENQDVTVRTDVTGVNLFLEVRKPERE